MSARSTTYRELTLAAGGWFPESSGRVWQTASLDAAHTRAAANNGDRTLLNHMPGALHGTDQEEGSYEMNRLRGLRL